MDNILNCTNCTGIDSCNKYCALKAGINLVNFINGVDVVETAIGELRDGFTKEEKLIVCGHGIECYPSPVYVLAGLDTAIDVSGKFKDYNGMTPVQILKAYLSTLNVSKDTVKNSIETFKKFNSNKLLPTPIKPGMECEVETADLKGTKTVECQVDKVYWNMNKQSKKLECTVSCSVSRGLFDAPTKHLQVSIVDYGDKIKLPSLERTLKSSEIDRDLIKMAPVGFIKPIVVEDKQYTIALDGRHMYRITNDTAYIIGSWKDNGVIDITDKSDTLKKSKAYKKLINSAKYIDRHRRFIVPYGLFETNYIKLK